jgi:IclR helix-turn-helix domain
MLMDLQECIKVVREIKEDPVPPKLSMRRIRAIGSQQKVLDFMSTRESFLPIEEISSHALLSISQTRRYLYQLHDRGLVERRYEGCRQLWRKKSLHD